MNKILQLTLNLPKKFVRAIWNGILKVSVFFWFCRTVIFWAVAIIGGCCGIGSISMYCTKWEVDPNHTFVGNYKVLRIDGENKCYFLLEDVTTKKRDVFVCTQLLRVNNEAEKLTNLKMSLVVGSTYKIVYVQEDESSRPVITKAVFIKDE